MFLSQTEYSLVILSYWVYASIESTARNDSKSVLQWVDVL